MWITADSNGLEYTRRQAVTSDTEASNTLIVPRGGMYLLTLSDSTRVWLNADSRLEYPLAFSGNMREVKLKGEAYFEVVKNAEAPFVVKTDLGDIKVLGTQFNVSRPGRTPACQCPELRRLAGKLTGISERTPGKYHAGIIPVV